MKRTFLMCSVGTLLLFGFNPRAAEACSRCNREQPMCEAANWRMCQVMQVSPTQYMCTESFSQCAWVYNALEISVDGSLAQAEDARDSTRGDVKGEVRGCHGLLLERAATSERSAQVRRESSRIVI